MDPIIVLASDRLGNHDFYAAFLCSLRGASCSKGFVGWGEGWQRVFFHSLAERKGNQCLAVKAGALLGGRRELLF